MSAKKENIENKGNKKESQKAPSKRKASGAGRDADTPSPVTATQPVTPIPKKHDLHLILSKFLDRLDNYRETTHVATMAVTNKRISDLEENLERLKRLKDKDYEEVEGQKLRECQNFCV